MLLHFNVVGEHEGDTQWRNCLTHCATNR